MNKSQIKSRIKPIIKECIQEILFEQGLLSSIIAEVVGGLQMRAPSRSGNLFNEQKELKVQQKELEEQKRQLEEERHQSLKEQKIKLLNATGFQTNVFEGVKPLSKGGSPDSAPAQASALSGVEPTDAGVDLTGIMAIANRDWGKMI